MEKTVFVVYEVVVCLLEKEREGRGMEESGGEKENGGEKKQGIDKGSRIAMSYRVNYV